MVMSSAFAARLSILGWRPLEGGTDGESEGKGLGPYALPLCRAASGGATGEAQCRPKRGQVPAMGAPHCVRLSRTLPPGREARQRRPRPGTTGKADGGGPGGRGTTHTGKPGRAALLQCREAATTHGRVPAADGVSARNEPTRRRQLRGCRRVAAERRDTPGRDAGADGHGCPASLSTGGVVALSESAGGGRADLRGAGVPLARRQRRSGGAEGRRPEAVGDGRGPRSGPTGPSTGATERGIRGALLGLLG